MLRSISCAVHWMPARTGSSSNLLPTRKPAKPLQPAGFPSPGPS